MVLDSDGKQTPETIDKDALIRRAVGRPFDVEWVGCSIWTPAKPRRRALRQGPRVPRRRRRASAFADRRARHEHRASATWSISAGSLRRWRRAGAAPKLLASYDSRAPADRRPRHRQHRGLPSLARKFRLRLCSDRGRQRTGSCAARLCRTAVGAPGWRHVPHHRPAARLPLRGVLRSSCRTARRRRRTIRRISSPPRVPARAPRMSRSTTAARRSIFTDLASCWCGFGADAPDGAEIAEAAKNRGVPLRSVTIDEPEAAAIYERKLVLVRPDGHVAVARRQRAGRSAGDDRPGARGLMHRRRVARHDRAAVADLFAGEAVSGGGRRARVLAGEPRRDIAGVEAVARGGGVDRLRRSPAAG